MNTTNIDIEFLTELNFCQLQEYCDTHPEDAADDTLWARLLAAVYPEIYATAIRIAFPDFETGKRTKHRKFLPMRELYTQLLAVAENKEYTDLVNRVLDVDSRFITTETSIQYVRLVINEDAAPFVAEFRRNFQLLSFLLASISHCWKVHLGGTNDPLIDYMEYSNEELRYRHSEGPHSERLALRYYKDPETDIFEEGGAAIWWAAMHGYINLVRFLLSHSRIDPAAYDNRAIQWAAMFGHAEVVELLLKHPRVDPSANENAALWLAARDNRIDVLNILLADGRANPAAKENNAIYQASMAGNVDIVKVLLSDPRVDPAEGNNRALHAACCYGHTEIVKVLLADSRIHLTEKSSDLIQLTKEKGHIEIVKILQEALCRYSKLIS